MYPSTSEPLRKETRKNSSGTREMEIIQDDSFRYEGYQVVRGEFFSHIFEPCISFNRYKAYVNTACIKKLPDTDYVQILVNPMEKKLAVRPSREDAKDSFRWCSATHKRSPKQITCRVFFAKVMHLMGWNPDYLYRLVGKLIQSDHELLFVFDLNTPEIFIRTEKNFQKSKTSRNPVYPAEWEHQFGIPAEEHQKSLQINIFNEYVVFSMQPKSAETSEPKEICGNII